MGSVYWMYNHLSLTSEMGMLLERMLKYKTYMLDGLIGDCQDGFVSGWSHGLRLCPQIRTVYMDQQGLW